MNVVIKAYDVLYRMLRNTVFANIDLLSAVCYSLSNSSVKRIAFQTMNIDNGKTEFDIFIVEFIFIAKFIMIDG